MLLDCGPGVFAKLRRYVDYVDVDAVVITHLHADHILDLVPFASGLRYGPRKPRRARPRLIAPPGALEAFAGMSEATAHDGRAHRAGLRRRRSTTRPTRVALGDLNVRFQPVPHFIPANAVELAADGARLTFSADCGPNDELCAFAAGTDLLLIEATLPEPDVGHLTPEQAGAHGARAGREARGADPLLRRARRRVGALGGRARVRRAGRRRPRRRGLRAQDRSAVSRSFRA